MRAPANCPVTLLFGATTSPYSPSSPHKGVDFAYIPDNTIYMPCDAVITQKPNNGADGNGTYFTAPDGTFQGLLHADHYLVPNGTHAKEGQAVAIMGETGNAEGKHVHWAVMRNGQYIDPLSLLSGGHGGGGEIGMPTEQEVRDYFYTYIQGLGGAPPTDKQIKDYTTATIDHLLSDLLQYDYEYAVALQKNVAELQKELAAGNAGYAPYNGSPLFTKVNGK